MTSFRLYVEWRIGSGRGLVWDIIPLFPWMQRVKPSKISGQLISRSIFHIRVLQNTKQEGMHSNSANGKLCQILQYVIVWIFGIIYVHLLLRVVSNTKSEQLKKETTSLQLQEYPHLPIDGASYLTLSSYGWSTFKRQKNRAIIAFKAVHFYRCHMCTP